MSCPMCSGEGVFMGTLGCLDHWCCRCCGAWFHTDHEEE